MLKQHGPIMIVPAHIFQSNPARHPNLGATAQVIHFSKVVAETEAEQSRTNDEARLRKAMDHLLVTERQNLDVTKRHWTGLVSCHTNMKDHAKDASATNNILCSNRTYSLFLINGIRCPVRSAGLPTVTNPGSPSVLTPIDIHHSWCATFNTCVFNQ
jgi:hypothetical protein